jgi:hypothetical protein
MGGTILSSIFLVIINGKTHGLGFAFFRKPGGFNQQTSPAVKAENLQI